jgi:hypothetical protein
LSSPGGLCATPALSESARVPGSNDGLGLGVTSGAGWRLYRSSDSHATNNNVGDDGCGNPG